MENNDKNEDKLLNDYMDYVESQQCISQAMSVKEFDRSQVDMQITFSQLSTKDCEMSSQPSQKSEKDGSMSM
jgi:hypothetical protein